MGTAPAVKLSARRWLVGLPIALGLAGCGATGPERKVIIERDPARPAQVLTQIPTSGFKIAGDRTVVPPSPAGVLTAYPSIPLMTGSTVPIAGVLSQDGKSLAWIFEDDGAGREVVVFGADGVVRSARLPAEFNDLPLALMMGKSSLYLVSVTFEPKHELRIAVSDLRLSGWKTRFTRGLTGPARLQTLNHRLPPTVLLFSADVSNPTLTGSAEAIEPNVRFTDGLRLPGNEVFLTEDLDEIVVVGRASRAAPMAQALNLLGGRPPQPADEWAGHVPLWASARVRMEPELLPDGAKPVALRYQLRVDLGEGRLRGLVRPITKTAPEEVQVLAQGPSGALLSRGTRIEFLPWEVSKSHATPLPLGPSVTLWAEAERRQRSVAAGWGERYRLQPSPAMPSQVAPEVWTKAGLSPAAQAELKWNKEPFARLAGQREDEAWTYPLATWPRAEGVFLLFSDGVVWQPNSADAPSPAPAP